jgi:hypothetical protein
VSEAQGVASEEDSALPQSVQDPESLEVGASESVAPATRAKARRTSAKVKSGETRSHGLAL